MISLPVVRVSRNSKLIRELGGIILLSGELFIFIIIIYFFQIINPVEAAPQESEIEIKI